MMARKLQLLYLTVMELVPQLFEVMALLLQLSRREERPAS